MASKLVKPCPFLEGRKICLRGLEQSDVRGKWLNWFNDKEVTKYMERGIYPNTREGLFDFYQHTVKGQNDLVLAILWKRNKKHIGNIGLHRIDWINRKAEFGLVVGEKNYWGKGAGLEATRLITEHGFSKLNLHKIFLGVRADHQAAVKTYEKAGYRIEAKLKDELYRDHRFHDIYIMSVFNNRKN